MVRINQCVELLRQGRPVFSYHPAEPPRLSYDVGRWYSDFWADMLVLDFEHYPFDIRGLGDFMRGLREATPGDAPTLTVIATLPCNGSSPEEVRANAWQARHALSTGIHGLMLAQASSPEAVEWFVAASRYGFQAVGQGTLRDGLRGAGGETYPAEIWGVSEDRYRRLADPWPLNPDGELLLGLKIEHRGVIDRAAAIAVVPGIAFAEWGPADMAMSFDRPGEADPPYAREVMAAMEAVRTAAQAAGVAFYSGWSDPAKSVEQQVDYLLDEIGARIIAAPRKDYADYGRERGVRR